MAPGTLVALPTAAVVLLVFASLASVSANLDGDALTALRNGLHDPDGQLRSWDPNLVDPCTWLRVTCNDDTKRVTRIDIGHLNLSGRLAPELGKLDQLQYMEIERNNIQGTIPSEFGNLKNLISLDLSENSISGTIPPSLGKLKSLKIMQLYRNRLTGPIPRELVGLSNLKVLDLSNNDLCGTIPTSGPFKNMPPSSFANNPRLKGPRMEGLGVDDTDC